MQPTKLQAADAKATELSRELESVKAERDSANAACNEVLNSLEWQGDGYSWNPPNGDYRESPMVALSRGQRKHVEALAALRDRLAELEREKRQNVEVVEASEGVLLLQVETLQEQLTAAQARIEELEGRLQRIESNARDAIVSLGITPEYTDTPDPVFSLTVLVAALQADRAALAERIRGLESELKSLAEFAAAHHEHQPAHVWLHALTVDIPARVESATSTGPQPLCKITRFDGFMDSKPNGDTDHARP